MRLIGLKNNLRYLAEKTLEFLTFVPLYSVVTKPYLIHLNPLVDFLPAFLVPLHLSPTVFQGIRIPRDQPKLGV